MRKGHKISCTVEEMVAKAKYVKGCHILAEITMQLNQTDWKPEKNVAIPGNSIVLAYPCGIRKGCNFALVIWRDTILAKISILKGKGLNLRAEPPRTKLYWVTPPPPGGGFELLFWGDCLISKCVQLTPQETKRCQTLALNYLCKLAGYTLNVQPASQPANIFLHLKARHVKIQGKNREYKFIVQFRAFLRYSLIRCL